MLAALENQFAPQAAKRGLKLKVCLRRRPPYNVHSDASILNQILGNLIDNAIKYTDSGWVVVAAVKISQDRLNVHVYDSGAGIADNMQEDIFKEFFRSYRRQTDGQSQGLGIGLAYVSTASKCLPDHSVRLCSRLGRGSDFQLLLPIAASIPTANCTMPLGFGFAGSFIFVVDDDLDVLDAMAKQLKAWGCLVQHATSKSETLAALAENLRIPDLLITDFYLGNQETAHDIVSAVQADCGPVPTLILSARSIPDQEKAKFPANTLLLRKPVGAAKLIETMALAMAK
jgi:CheY-like chemotaxis protein